jgi:hypothetical protein
VRKVATLVGEPLVVDELSLIKTGPVRVKLNYRDPSKLRDFVKIFFNKVGHNICFVYENYKDKLMPRFPQPLDNKDDDVEEGEEEEEDVDSDSDRKHKKRTHIGQSAT